MNFGSNRGESKASPLRGDAFLKVFARLFQKAARIQRRVALVARRNGRPAFRRRLATNFWKSLIKTFTRLRRLGDAFTSPFRRCLHFAV